MQRYGRMLSPPFSLVDCSAAHGPCAASRLGAYLLLVEQLYLSSLLFVCLPALLTVLMRFHLPLPALLDPFQSRN